MQAITAPSRSLIAHRRNARARARQHGDRSDKALGAFQPILQIWRTDADSRCWDLNLEPSDRKYGSLWGADPYASNFGSVGFARLCTPESWLSTWSELTSNATLEKAAPSIEQPVPIVGYTGDPAVYRSDIDRLMGWIPAADKSVALFVGDHHGAALAPGEPAGREAAGQNLVSWLRSRY
jgi:hypothetical protein